LVDEKIHGRNTGPVNGLTHQATEGRQRDGQLGGHKVSLKILIFLI